jgi:hypothetical protein
MAYRRDVAVLAFPSDNYVAPAIGRPLFAPVLENYAASTSPLERYYIQALDRQRRAGIDILYGQDTALMPPGEGIQSITRSPIVFEYLYTHFDLVRDDEHAASRHLLRPRSQPREMTIEELPFSTPQRVVDAGVLKLHAPSTCGLIRMQIRIDYLKNPHFFRPGGVEMNLVNGDHVIWMGSIRPLEPNQSFVTYISPLSPTRFHKLFGRGPVPGLTWDKLQYRYSRTDMLGAPARRIEVESLQCVDAQKFLTDVAPAPAGPPATS